LEDVVVDVVRIHHAHLKTDAKQTLVPGRKIEVTKKYVPGKSESK
jgi:hypothetical protein